MRSALAFSALIFTVALGYLGWQLTSAPPDTPAHRPQASKPICPPAQVGGIELPCLHGQVGQENSDQITVVNIWAFWCAPCRKELPYFDTLAHQHPQWRVMSVHADPNSAAGAKFIDELGLELPTLSDTQGVFAAELGLPKVVPITLVFSGTQRIAIFPQVFDSQQDLDSAISAVVKEVEREKVA
ncbi:TlpA family protein disulfide reductase [Corynebacterium sp. ES2730-CONJ]|uniref:TlpA family protein disulfide reductase n=1 Tax=Corynebacterium sp. ES2730-CONJ TaxID=2973941 RepID=UPI00216ACCBC|nr:TlpA disulfide reductase family protein [Corynebacterium sp. ES2730-CONJ]MCS4532204.1 TlpA family protein disulfide reductase [Corynebacterium sp. ES2730-CONJ]